MDTLKIVLIILPLHLLSVGLFGQPDLNSSYQKAEDYLGFNDILVNGPMYIPLHPKADGTPLFVSNQWFGNTNLYIKEIEFENEYIQYDLLMDKFILRKSSPSGEIYYIELNSLAIDSIRLQDHFFVKGGDISRLAEELGFVELIYKGDIVFFVKHSRIFKSTYTEDKLFGEFSEQLMSRYLLLGNELISVNSFRAFSKHVDKPKSQIKKFMKANQFKYKKASPGQLKQLLNYCYEN